MVEILALQELHADVEDDAPLSTVRLVPLQQHPGVNPGRPGDRHADRRAACTHRRTVAAHLRPLGAPSTKEPVVNRDFRLY